MSPAEESARLSELLKEAKQGPVKPLAWEGIKPLNQMNGEAPPVILDGLWRQEEVLLLGGHSKSWKSWAQMDLMFAIANNFGWLVWPRVNGGRVLHIDLELFPHEIRHRYDLIAESYQRGTLANIDVLSLRGVSFKMNDFSELADHIEPGKYRAISFDPTYRMLAGNGLSESDAGVVIDVLNRALEVAKKLKAGIDLLQHFSKGNQSEKRAIDAFSGSGVWGRAPDACVTFREHEDEKCYTVTVDLRHWAPVESFVVEWDYPRFRVAAAKDPEQLKVHKTGRPIAFSAESLCKLVEDDEYVSFAHLKRRAEAANVKKNTFERRLKDAKERGYLAMNPTDSTYFLTSSYLGKYRT